MESVSIWHWLLLVILYLGPMIWSSVRILKRIGFSGWWTVVSIIPLVNSLVWAVPSRRSGFMRCEDISCTLVHLPLRNAYLMATLSLVTLVCPLKGIYGSRRQAMACRFGTFTSCSRRLAFLCGLLLSTAGQAWSAGAPLAHRSSRPASTTSPSLIRSRGLARPWFSSTVAARTTAF